MTAGQTAYWIGAVAASLIVGGALGLIPLLFGEYAGEAKLGRMGLLCSVIGGFIAGIFGALPVALGFTVAIAQRRRMRRRDRATRT